MAEWELCKENIQPLKQGRKVNTLNTVLAVSTSCSAFQGYILSSKVIFFRTPLFVESYFSPFFFYLRFRKIKLLLSDAIFHHIFSPELVFPYTSPPEVRIENIYPWCILSCLAAAGIFKRQVPSIMMALEVSKVKN